MFTIVCYDSPSNRRRRRLARIAGDHVTRVQKSVFEGHLDPDRFRRLVERLEKVVDTSVDRLRIYQLPMDALDDVRIYGKPPLERPELIYWVGPEDGGDVAKVEVEPERGP